MTGLYYYGASLKFCGCSVPVRGRSGTVRTCSSFRSSAVPRGVQASCFDCLWPNPSLFPLVHAVHLLSFGQTTSCTSSVTPRNNDLPIDLHHTRNFFMSNTNWPTDHAHSFAYHHYISSFISFVRFASIYNYTLYLIFVILVHRTHL
jgi:hypothetical protein